MADMNEIGNRVVNETLAAFMRPLLDAGATDAEIMVTLESLVLGVALATERTYRVPRRVTVAWLEIVIERVHERLGAIPGAPVRQCDGNP